MSDLHDILACPRCDNPLDGLRCAACRIDLPENHGLHWLFAEPEVARADWRNRWNLALSELERSREQAERSARHTQSEKARARLDKLVDGYARQRRALTELLDTLSLGTPADRTTYLGLRTRLPTHVGLRAYEANVFRDWCWGDAENTASLDAVVAAIGTQVPVRILVLGAGAGRLAYDVHQRFSPALTVALDVNPYPASVLRKVASGEVVTLTEFPVAPRSAAQVALVRELRAPRPAHKGFEVVLADAQRPPFRPGSFDLVLTPWLLDVIDAPAAELLARINVLLSAGGAWINHGSLAFERPDPADCPDLEELQELATGLGFGELAASEVDMPYLDCPDSRHGRRESVVTLRASKQADCEAPARHQSLPDWIARGREPVPLSSAFQTQAMTTRMHAFIMTLIDGNRSLQDIAQVLEEQQLMPRADAEAAIRGFLIRMHEEARQSGD